MEHALPLRNRWKLWRWCALRGAGFPASIVLRLGKEEILGKIDAVFAAEEETRAARRALFEKVRDLSFQNPADPVLRRARRHADKGFPARDDVAGVAEEELTVAELARDRAATLRAELAREFAGHLDGTTRMLAEAAAATPFREALTWQNRAAAGRVRLDAAAVAEMPGFRRRQRESVIAGYLHRYAMKNDTIGFFGPVGWATWESGGEPIMARPGPSLMARRAVYFEQWCLDALAATFDADEEVRSWCTPRRFGYVRVDGDAADDVVTGRQSLDPGEAAVLRACDGRVVAVDLADALVRGGGFSSRSEVFGILHRLGERNLIAWRFSDLPTRHPAEDTYREAAARIRDGDLRARVLAPLGELDSARSAVAEAVGQPEALARALDELDIRFRALTGAEATRNAGMTYASRGLVFEDGQRDFSLRLGPKVRDELAPALTLVLDSARWLTWEVARAYDAPLREAHAQLAEHGPVSLGDFWFRVQRIIHGSRQNKPYDAVARAARAKWAEILGVTPGARAVEVRSSDIAARVRAEFAAPRAGWVQARLHSPDIMIAARDVESIARGDYQAVLGELHLTLNTITWNLFLAQHPAPEEIQEALGRDVPGRIMRVPSRASKTGSVRWATSFLGPEDVELETGLERSGLPRDRVVALADYVVELTAEGLVARPFAGGEPTPIMEWIGRTLGAEITNTLDFAHDDAHGPRITIDRFVVRRESWRLLPSAMTFAFAETELETTVLAWRLAREHGIPRFAFAKSPLEPKPLYVDFANIVSVRILAKMVRQAKENAAGELPISFSEMLPTPDQLWLTDEAGERYTSELRLVVADECR